MDVIEFFSALIDQWNTGSKCGLCWKFTAPLTQDALNIYQLRADDKCCVLVAITDLTQETQIRTDPKSLLTIEKKRISEFQVHFLSTEKLGVNNYDEIKNHPLSESKWSNIVKPIWDCVGEPDEAEWCGVLGDKLVIERWRGTMKLDWMDENYCGWTFNVRLVYNV